MCHSSFHHLARIGWLRQRILIICVFGCKHAVPCSCFCSASYTVESMCALVNSTCRRVDCVLSSTVVTFGIVCRLSTSHVAILFVQILDIVWVFAVVHYAPPLKIFTCVTGIEHCLVVERIIHHRSSVVLTETIFSPTVIPFDVVFFQWHFLLCAV